MNKNSKSKSTIKRGSKAKRILLIIFTIVLIGALATSVTFNVMMYKKLAKATVTPPLAANTAEVDKVIVSPGFAAGGMKMKARGAVAAADSSVVVPVSVSADTQGAEDELALDWTASFADSTAAWAQGKTVSDYVTVTPVQDGAWSANITVKAPFGAQISVIASLRDKPQKRVTCAVDYAVKYSFDKWTFESSSTKFAEYSEGVIGSQITPVLAKTTGTTDKDLKPTVSVKLGEAGKSFITALHNGSGEFWGGEINDIITYFAKSANAALELPFSISDNVAKFNESTADDLYIDYLRIFGYLMTTNESHGSMAADPDSTYAEYLNVLSENYGQSYIDDIVDELGDAEIVEETILNPIRAAIAAVESTETLDSVIINDFFTLSVSLSSDYCTVNETVSLALSIPKGLIAKRVGSLTIDPPSVIV